MKAPLLDALRDLRSRGRATAVAIGGLTIGLAACLLVALFALALAAPDPDVVDPERAIMLDFKGNPPGEPSPWFGAAPVAFGPLLKARHAPLDLVSRAGVNGIELMEDGRSNPALVLAVDADIVEVLNLRSLAGDLRSTLQGHDTIAITADLLRKLWGALPPAQAVGRRVLGHGRWYTVTAVLPDTDPRSPLYGASPLVGGAMVMCNFDSSANEMSAADRDAIFLMTGHVFARLRPGTRVEQVGGWMRDAFMHAPQFQQLPPAWRAGREAAWFRGVTVSDIPFDGPDRVARWEQLGAVGAASVLLLVLAALNAMSLQAAHMLQRQRETALRRSLGAAGTHLVRLWATEALLPLAASAAGALLLAWWVAPAVADWLQLPAALPLADPMPGRALLGLVAMVLVLLPLTIALPARAALRRAPAAGLQGRTASEGPWGRRLRQGLLGLQLAGALLLLSVSGVLALQQHHLLHVDRGFDTHDRLVLMMETEPEHVPRLDAFEAALSHDPAIRHWSYSYSPPASDWRGPEQRELDTSADGHTVDLRMNAVGASFFDTYGMTVLAGTPRYAQGEHDVVIDAKAARLLGFPSPQAAVGEVVHGGGAYLQKGDETRRIVAVVKDVNLGTARGPAMPQAFWLMDSPQWVVTATGPDPKALWNALDGAWKAHGLQVPHELKWADDQRADVYRQEAQLTATVAVLALLAVLVAMIGAYAMVADTLRRRRTELVLHRLHGAGDAAIARQVAGEFGLPLLGAVLVALPLAGWIGTRYLDGFHDRVGWLPGLLAPLAAALAATLLVTALASLRHVRQALALQPIEALS
ncbi:MAG: ABC transporter permease [Burkholderiales bacterium]|nr:ABC transporter permease [Burkholderiales bacterium]